MLVLFDLLRVILVDFGMSAACPVGRKMRRTQCEQMSSGLPLKADIAQYSRHVSKVPKAVIRAALGRDKPARSRRNGLSRRRAKRKAT